MIFVLFFSHPINGFRRPSGYETLPASQHTLFTIPLLLCSLALVWVDYFSDKSLPIAVASQRVEVWLRAGLQVLRLQLWQRHPQERSGLYIQQGGMTRHN